MCWQFGQQSAVGANGVQSALFWCRGAQSARAAYPPIFVLPQVPAAPRTLSCEDCVHSAVHIYVRSHWQCTVPTGGKGRPSGLPRLARSAQIHSKCLPHSPPTRRAPFSTILAISHLYCKCAPTHCHLIKLLKLTKHIRHPVAPTLKITCQPYMACPR